MALQQINSTDIATGSALGSIGANNITATYLQTGAVETALTNNGTSFGMKNRIINGDMRIDQRSAGAAQTGVSPGSAYWLTDRFRIGGNSSGALRFTFQQVTDAPSGFNKSGKVTVTTNQSSFASGDLNVLSHIIEGYNTIDFAWGTSAAAYATLSFWVKCSVVGSYSVSVNGPIGYTANYTINSANTWEYKTIVVPPATTGTWTLDSGSGIRIDWNLGSGSSSTGSGSVWQGTGIYSVTGSTQLGSTNGATWQITGVQLEKGSLATQFEFRDYGRELALCQRYYYSTKNLSTAGNVPFGSGMWYDSTHVSVYCKFPVSMRTFPSFSYTGNLIVYYGAGYTSVSGVGATYMNNDSMWWQPVASGGTAGQGSIIFCNGAQNSNYFELTAEL